MDVQHTTLPDVLVLEPRLHADARGHFFESFNARTFAQVTGLERTFVQDNQSHSVRGVLRGLHYQLNQPQGKLVRVLHGEIFDVAVDLRRSSPTFGRWVGMQISADNRRQVWIPEGFAHGFLVTSETADVLYKTTDFYAPGDEHAVRWCDPTLAIDWPLAGSPILTTKDADALWLEDAATFA